MNKNNIVDSYDSLNVRILYVSCGDNGLYSLKNLVSSGHNIVAVVTVTEAVATKYRISGYVDFTTFCKSTNIPIINLNTYTLSPDDVLSVEYDMLIVNGWNRLIDPILLDSSKYGGIGVHAGHPPIGHGRAPLVWNILLGHKDIEVYAFKLTKYADDGDILSLKVVEITDYDSVRHLYEKVMHAASEILPEAISSLVLSKPSIKQQLAYAVQYKKRTAEDGLIDFSQNEMEIYNFIRAQSPPYPGAFAMLDGAKWNIIKAQPYDRFAFRDIQRIPGTIICNLPSGLVVQTGGTSLWITEFCVDGQMYSPANFEKMESFVGKVFNRK